MTVLLPGHRGWGQVQLGQCGEVDSVAEIQHEQLTLLRLEFWIPGEIICNSFTLGAIKISCSDTFLRQELSGEKCRNM